MTMSSGTRRIAVHAWSLDDLCKRCGKCPKLDVAVKEPQRNFRSPPYADLAAPIRPRQGDSKVRFSPWRARRSQPGRDARLQTYVKAQLT
jgi:hypothetical protein